MDKALRPERFGVIPDTPTAAKEFKHWLKTFDYYCEALPQDGLNKLRVLTNFVSPAIYDYFSDCTDYDAAVQLLTNIYVKPTNTIFARHLLANRRQQAGESIDQFLQALKFLSKDCQFTMVDAKTHTGESIRDAFITGIQSNTIRQCLLENKTFELTTIYFSCP